MIASFLTSEFVSTVGKVIDELVTSEEERGNLKLKFLEQQLEAVRESNKVELAQLNAEVELMKAKRDIILAESKADSWITKSWRPITMLTLVFGIIAHQLGIDDAVASYWGGHGISDEYVGEYFTLVTVGLGGYVTMRGVEKAVKTWKQTPQRLMKSRSGEKAEPIGNKN